jgi:hypothetical protein
MTILSRPELLRNYIKVREQFLLFLNNIVDNWGNLSLHDDIYMDVRPLMKNNKIFV